jgi:hypothetical protein
VLTFPSLYSQGKGSHDKKDQRSEQTDIILTNNLAGGTQDSRTETSKPFSPKLDVLNNRIWSFFCFWSTGQSGRPAETIAAVSQPANTPVYEQTEEPKL